MTLSLSQSEGLSATLSTSLPISTKQLSTQIAVTPPHPADSLDVSVSAETHHILVCQSESNLEF